MAEQEKEISQEQSEGKEQDQSQKPELTAIELKAIEGGWVPQDEWDGDPDQWRPAREFLDRGELFKKIEDQNRTIKEFKKALQDFQSHHTKVRETEYKRALEALKAQKKTALEEGNADAVVAIDDRIDLVREEQSRLRETPQTQVDSSPNPEFISWVERNKWYENDRAMKAFADELGRELHLRGNEPADVLKEVERQVKAEFSHKFRNPNRDKSAAVEGSSAKGSGKGSDSYQLSDEERRVMQRFIRTIPGFSEKDYIAELKRVKNGA